jgi:FtsH-binding integral membrane protein
MGNNLDRHAIEKLGSQTGIYDQGLRSYMLGIYNYMSLGLALTGLVAFLLSTNVTLMNAIFGTGLHYIVIFAPLAFVLFLGFKIQTISVHTAQMIFWAFATTMGVSLSSIFLVYTGVSIAKTFFITAGTFAAMSLYGYTTQRDLTAIGSFLFMGLIGIILASLVNLFLHSSALEFAVSVIGVFIFVGLTAYDTQMIKGLYYSGDDATTAEKKSIMGALQLYLDFINLFLYFLRFIGDRRN